MTIKEFLTMFYDISALDLIVSNGTRDGLNDTICVAGGNVQFLDGEFTSVADDETYSVEEILEEIPEERVWMMRENRDVWSRQMVVSRLNTVFLDMEVVTESVKFDKHELSIGVSEANYTKLYGAIGGMFFD